MISILLSTYNRCELLRRCISSLLCQTFKSFELIIADDGSTDLTESVVQSFNDKRIKYFKFEHAGVYQLRNRALKKCKYRYIAVADDDDVYHATHLETLYAEFKKDKTLGCAYGGMYRHQSDGKLVDVMMPKEFSIPRLLWGNMTIMHGTTMWNRRWMDRIPYPTAYDFAGDYIFFLEAAKKGCKFKSTGKVTYSYYMYPDSISRRVHWSERTNLCTLYVKQFLDSLSANTRFEYGKVAAKIAFENFLETTKPLVSIMVSYYNQNALLQRLLECLKKQTYNNLEIIVANDGSRHPKIEGEVKYYWHPHTESRRSVLRNMLMKMSSGQIFIFIDSDMSIDSDFVEKILLRHYENPNLFLIHAIHENGCIRRFHNSRIWQSMGGTFSIRKCNALKIGLFDTQFNGAWGFEDTDWAYRAFKMNMPIEYARDVFVNHTPHDHNDLGNRNRKLFEKKHNINTLDR